MPPVRRGEIDPGRVTLFSSALPGWDAARTVALAGSLGLDAVEWGAGPGEAIDRPDEGPAIRELCDQAGIRVCGLAVQDGEVALDRPERAAPYVALAGVLGAPHVRFMTPPYRGGPLRREQRAAQRGLGEISELSARTGVRVLVETSCATLAPSPDLVAALIEDLPPDRVGALYDPGNMVIEGHVSPALALARLAPYVHHVHVKNVAWSRRSGLWRWAYASLAGGLLSWPEIVTLLAAAGYRGRFSIDHLGGRPTVELLRAELVYLRSLLARVE